MSQYRIDERDCPHPDFALKYRSALPYQPYRPAIPKKRDHYGRVVQWGQPEYKERLAEPAVMLCCECGWKYPVQDEQDFVKQRELKYIRDEGKSPLVKRDMFGNEIKVGSMVVYPTLSGRSATLSYGKVIEINPKTTSPNGWHEWAHRPRCDVPDRLKIQPMPYTSRWKSWRGEDAKPVTLSVNAVSVVVIK